MAKTLEFFFDYISPTSFIARVPVQDVIARTGATLKLRPLFQGGVMKATGNSPPGMVPAKGAYMAKDMARICKRYGLELHFNKHFPMMNTRPLTCATIRLQDDPEEQMKLFEAGWKHVWGLPGGGIDTGDEAQFVAAMNAEGFDGEKLWALGNDPESKAMLRANTEEAVERGAFGSPTFFVGDEIFFGHDRLDYVEEELMA
ncbi:MAG: 2-hydroxychromene-2-carboxylate isomerase [Pseudomonadota bacterium]